MEERSSMCVVTGETDSSKVEALESRLMERAFELAREAFDATEVPVGCVLYDVDSQRIVGEGRNDTMRTLDATRHAELVALDQVFEARAMASHANEPDASTQHPLRLHVFVTCEPCIMCAQALVTAGCVERVVFGCRNPRFGGCGTVLDATSGLRMEQSRDPDAVERGAAVFKEFYARDNQRVVKADTNTDSPQV
jgi:tRNA-specific adenosine deaminase 2